MNLIEPRRNYGWPIAEGANHPPELASPVSVYRETVAPSDAAFSAGEAIPQWRGSFLFGTLRGQHLHRLTLSPDDPRGVVTEERLYDREYGRLREVTQGPDGALYVTTSNRNGNIPPGSPNDRNLRIAPASMRSIRCRPRSPRSRGDAPAGSENGSA